MNFVNGFHEGRSNSQVVQETLQPQRGNLKERERERKKKTNNPKAVQFSFLTNIDTQITFFRSILVFPIFTFLAPKLFILTS